MLNFFQTTLQNQLNQTSKVCQSNSIYFKRFSFLFQYNYLRFSYYAASMGTLVPMTGMAKNAFLSNKLVEVIASFYYWT